MFVNLDFHIQIFCLNLTSTFPVKAARKMFIFCEWLLNCATSKSLIGLLPYISDLPGDDFLCFLYFT